MQAGRSRVVSHSMSAVRASWIVMAADAGNVAPVSPLKINRAGGCYDRVVGKEFEMLPHDRWYTRRVSASVRHPDWRYDVQDKSGT